MGQDQNIGTGSNFVRSSKWFRFEWPLKIQFGQKGKKGPIDSLKIKTLCFKLDQWAQVPKVF